MDALWTQGRWGREILVILRMSFIYTPNSVCACLASAAVETVNLKYQLLARRKAERTHAVSFKEKQLRIEKRIK